MDVVGDEEQREGDAVQAAERGRHRDGHADAEGRGGQREQAHAEPHEEAAAQSVHPDAHQRLTQDARHAEHALDEADIRLAAPEPLDVQREQEEAVEREEEEEVGEHGPRVRTAQQDLERGGHRTGGRTERRSRMACDMRRQQYSTRARA